RAIPPACAASSEWHAGSRRPSEKSKLMKTPPLPLSILPLLFLAAGLAADDLPKRPEFTRYAAMLNHSPFAVATAVATPVATPNPPQPNVIVPPQPQTVPTPYMNQTLPKPGAMPTIVPPQSPRIRGVIQRNPSAVAPTPIPTPYVPPPSANDEE